MTTISHTFLDLFAGCGGLSEGFYQEGFKALAHVEIDNRACETLRLQMGRHGYGNAESAVLQADITDKTTCVRLKKAVGNRTVDVIVGGPPCQSFSKQGRVRCPENMQNDPRNYLFEQYVEILNIFRPKVFIFENVKGILTQNVKGKKILDIVLAELGKHYKLLEEPEAMLLDAVHYGVPQERTRIFIIGVRRDMPLQPEDIYSGIARTHYGRREAASGSLNKFTSVRDAIGDLPQLHPGEGQSPMRYNPTAISDYAIAMHGSMGPFIHDHIVRTHNEGDIKRFTEMAKRRWNFLQLLEHRPDLGHPKRRVFFNSYKVQWWENPAKTIISHLYKDGNQFIHPDWRQGRSLTVREAARLQSFPDDFEFAGPRTEQFKQIGNAVPPLMASAIARSIRKKLHELKRK